VFSCASASSLRYRDGVRTAAAVAATVWFFGASFGLVARSAGMGVLAPFVMSATTFAGSAQFAAASILAGNGSAVVAITAAQLLNARYVPISISVAQPFHGPHPRRLAESQPIVDESWALAARRTLRPEDPDRRRAAAVRRLGVGDRGRGGRG
jgi:predicted branched-subunit amino acid permease